MDVLGLGKGRLVDPSSFPCFPEIDFGRCFVDSDGEVDQVDMLMAWFDILQQDADGLVKYFDRSPGLAPISGLDQPDLETTFLPHLPYGGLLG